MTTAIATLEPQTATTATLPAPLSNLAHNAELLQKIMNWDFSAEEQRFQKEFPHEDVAKASHDFRIFLYLTIADGVSYFIPSFPADHMWHVSLWFTHNWQAFSMECNNGVFFHHNPMSEALPEDEAREKLDAIQEACIRHFGSVIIEISDVVCCS